jgi:hypothetical protein
MEDPTTSDSDSSYSGDERDDEERFNGTHANVQMLNGNEMMSSQTSATRFVAASNGSGAHSFNKHINGHTQVNGDTEFDFEELFDNGSQSNHHRRRESTDQDISKLMPKFAISNGITMSESSTSIDENGSQAQSQQHAAQSSEKYVQMTTLHIHNTVHSHQSASSIMDLNTMIDTLKIFV